LRVNRPSRLALPAAVAFGLSLFAVSLTWQVPAVAASSGPIDAQAAELVRLMNGARAAEGKPALKVDPFLASKARDGAIPCPDDASDSIAGRAKDFAAYNEMSHQLRLCNAASYKLSGTLFVSVLQDTWSYWNVGEIDLDNGGYGNGAFLYTYSGSKTWQSWTYSTTGHGMMGWETSKSHWDIIMGSYDRVGCGGWASGSTYYYDCAFSVGGSSPDGLRSAPTRSPFDNSLPTPAPTARPTPRPTARPTAPPARRAPAPTGCGTHAAKPVASASASTSASAGAGASSGSGATPSSGPTVAPPSASPTASPVATASTSDEAAQAMQTVDADQTPEASATPQVAAAAGLQESGGDGVASAGGPSGMPASIARFVALVSGSGAMLLAGCSLILSSRRRRRGRGDETAVRLGPPAD
jgi:hypothetical protein